jgi:hypothetical protein
MNAVLCIIGVCWLSFATVFVFALVRAPKKQVVKTPMSAQEGESLDLKRAA